MKIPKRASAAYIYNASPVLMPRIESVRKIGIYFIGFFLAFGFGSAGIVAFMSAVRYSLSSTSLM